MRAAIVCLGLSLAALGGCASDKKEARVPGDPAICAERDFNIYYDSWQADLSPEAKAEIAVVQNSLKSCQIQHVRIVGMAGAPGDEAANLKISQERADGIAAALETGGWPRKNFEIVAIGEKDASTPDGLDKPMRRRVHVVVRAAP